MLQLATEEGIFIVEKYTETKSFVTVQSQFASIFNHRSPCKKSI